MFFSDATGRKVVSTSTAEPVGQVADFVVDPLTQSVVALILKKSADGDTLLWSSLASFGTDAVTVSGAEMVAPAPDGIIALSGKHHRLLGKRILNTAGEDLGTVRDVNFDPESGAVVELSLADGGIDGRRLIGIGSYAVVVSADA